MLKIITAFTGLAVSAAALALPVSAARADSCWNHNGSIMRLKASGSQRWFYYENPKGALRRAGVAPGTLLFDGQKNGDAYSGTTRRFSRFCPDSPMEYYASGPVRGDQLQVTLHGRYQVHDQCYMTGATRDDTLVFTYAYDC